MTSAPTLIRSLLAAASLACVSISGQTVNGQLDWKQAPPAETAQ